MSVYHKYAACSPFDDAWSRFHIHGLNVSYLLKYGLKDEKTLIEDFKRWLDQFLVVTMYANDPNRELVKLNLRIIDIGLPKWTERVKRSYHQIPHNYKMSGKRSCHICCKQTYSY